MTYKTFTYPEYISMWNVILKWEQENGRLPNYVDFNGLRIFKAEYLDAYDRVLAFRNSHQGNNPDTVGINGTLIITPSPGNPVPPIVQEVRDAVGFNFNTFTQFYNIVKTEIYSHYVNDVYSLAGEIARLKSKSGLNCVDFSQVGYFGVAAPLGYSVRFIHVYCTVSKVGHVRLQVKGHELGDSWVNVDLAAAACSNYNIGNVWCYSGNLLGIDESWLFHDIR